MGARSLALHRSYAKLHKLINPDSVFVRAAVRWYTDGISCKYSDLLLSTAPPQQCTKTSISGQPSVSNGNCLAAARSIPDTLRTKSRLVKVVFLNMFCDFVHDSEIDYDALEFEIAPSRTCFRFVKESDNSTRDVIDLCFTRKCFKMLEDEPKPTEITEEHCAQRTRLASSVEIVVIVVQIDDFVRDFVAVPRRLLRRELLSHRRSSARDSRTSSERFCSSSAGVDQIEVLLSSIVFSSKYKTIVTDHDLNICIQFDCVRSFVFNTHLTSVCIYLFGNTGLVENVA